MRETFKLFLVAVTAAAAASWATPRAQPLDAEFRSLHVENFAAAGEVRMFSVDADASVAGAQCPAGWTPFTAAAGRFPVAVTNSGTLAGTLGAAYADTDGPVRRGGTAQRVTAQPSGSASASFRGTAVTPSATFTGSRVTPRASFRGTAVTPRASFRGTAVTPRASFRGTTASPRATFTGSRVTPRASFRGTAVTHTHGYRSASDATSQLVGGFNSASIIDSYGSRRTTDAASITSAGTVSVSPITPSGTVSVSPITPSGTVSVSPITPSGAVSVSPITSRGTVSVSPITPRGTVSVSVSVSSVTVATTDQAPPAPGIQLRFCVAEQ